MLKYLIPAVLAATLAPAIATAQDIPAAVHVAYRDLDLRTSAGVRALNRRIEAAVAAVCPEFVAVNLATERLVANCQASARAGAAAQREAVLAKAGRADVQLADRAIR